MNEPSVVVEAHEKAKNAAIVELMEAYADYLVENKKATKKEDLEQQILPMISKMMDTGMCSFNVLNKVKDYIDQKTLDLLKEKRETVRFCLFKSILHRIMDERDKEVSSSDEKMVEDCDKLRQSYREMKNNLMTRYKGIFDDTVKEVFSKFEKSIESEFVNLVK